jgi:hypothetical protein
MAAQPAVVNLMKSQEDVAAAAAAAQQQHQQQQQQQQQQQHPIISIDQDMHRAPDLQNFYMTGIPSGLGAVPMGAGGHLVGAGGKGRKPRFTKEQHAAIMESVERNFKEHPSRYTELVIKEMKDRYPHLDITSACVRKLKFR